MNFYKDCGSSNPENYEVMLITITTKGTANLASDCSYSSTWKLPGSLCMCGGPYDVERILGVQWD